MFDVHAHVIPYVDDGAKDAAVARRMLQEMYQQGIEGVIATPHIRLGKFNNHRTSLVSAFDDFRQTVTKSGDIPALKLAAEVHLTVDLMHWVMNDQVPYLAQVGGQKYVLLELPETHLPSGAINLCKWLVNHQITPVIAHPERYRYWQTSPLGMTRFLELGCLLQLTASSITGQFRQDSLALAMQLIEGDKVFCVASDAHNLTNRACKMREAKEKIEHYCGVEIAQTLFVNNPKMLFSSCIDYERTSPQYEPN